MKNLLLYDNAVLRYVVPFYFGSEKKSGACREELAENRAYEELHSAFEKSRDWVREERGTKERDTYEFIQNALFGDDADKVIGRGWLYNLDGQEKKFRFAKEKAEPEYIQWKFEQLGVYVFRTNVGFLWYEISLDQEVRIDADKFVFFQNRFKELHRSNGKEVLELLEVDGTCKKLKLGKWLSDIMVDVMKDAAEEIHYFDRIWTKKDVKVAGDRQEVPDKAHIFNYILMEDTEEEADVEKRYDKLCQAAYLFGNGYTSRYRMAEVERGKMISPFRDVCWYAAKEGSGYYALKNAGNESFFTAGLCDKIKADYFLLFILALHQSYSLANYLRRISEELSANPVQYVNASEAGTILDEIVVEVNTFLMKSMYMSVSHVHHQNLFFEYLQQRLKIQEDIESINMGTNALVKLQRIRKEKEEALRERELERQRQVEREQEELKEKEQQRIREEAQDREAESDRRLNLSLAILSVFAIFSTLLDCAEFLGEFKKAWGDKGTVFSVAAWQQIGVHIAENEPWSYFALVLYGVVILLSVVCLTMMIKSVFSYIKNRWNIRRKNRAEKKAAKQKKE